MRIEKPRKKRKKSLRIDKLVRECVITRDNNTCQITGHPAEEIHHILYRSRGGNNTSYNLICLSRYMHEQVHKNGKKWFKILFIIQQKKYPELTIELMKRRK